MGTRHLVVVVCDGETKVAQYGQWDGYPEGAGVECLAFLRQSNLDTFREKIRSVKEITPERLKEIDRQCGIPEDAKFLNMEQVARLKRVAPELSRDTSTDILSMILDGRVTSVHLAAEFANESLFCEWAYVIDLDANAFEVYRGFQKKPHTLGRFASGAGKDGYCPVALDTSFSLTALPSDDEFLAAFKEPEEAAV